MRRVTPYLMLLPMMLLVGLLLASLGDGLLQSLGYFPPAGLTSFTLDYYRTVLQDPALHGSVLYSLYLAFTSALLSTAGGVALSALLVACKRPDSLLLRLPITIPHTVAAFLGMALLSQTGLFSRLAALMGLVQAPDAFPLLIQDPWGIGVILTYTCKQIPYVMSVVVLLMRRVWGSGAQAARTLGAGPVRAFFTVTLPLSMPAISTAFIIIFAYAFGAYELPFLLGATLPRAFPVQAYMEFLSPDLSHRPFAMVYNGLMLAFGAGFIALYLAAFKKLNRDNQAVRP